MSKVVWITGANGFIGKNLMERLTPDKYDVYKISQHHGDGKNQLYYNHLYPDGRLGQLPTPHIVFHLAAVSSPSSTSEGIFKFNVDYTKAIIENVHKRRANCNFIFTSSVNVYGYPEYAVDEESVLMPPKTLYATSKIMAETILGYYSQLNSDIKVRILRLAGVVGKGMTHGIIPDIVKKLKNNPNEIPILGKRPGTKKCYVHIDDVCFVLMLASEGRLRSLINNVFHEHHQEISSEDVVSLISLEMGLTPKHIWTGASYQGDSSAPNIFHANEMKGIQNLFKYKGGYPALKNGIKDYLCVS